MNRDTQNPNHIDNGKTAARGDAEETLRLLAQLPAPAGLEGRIHHKLRTAARTGPHDGRVLAWPLPAKAGREWMRAVAAAAIAFVIAGGGWGVYSRVQPRRVEGITLTPHGAPGGFAGANAVRTPQTIDGPVVSGPAVSGPVVTSPAATHPAETKSAMASVPAPMQAPAPVHGAKKNAAHNAAAEQAGAAAQHAAATQK
jgi:cytoskeletal protein RodZ